VVEGSKVVSVPEGHTPLSNSPLDRWQAGVEGETCTGATAIGHTS